MLCITVTSGLSIKPQMNIGSTRQFLPSGLTTSFLQYHYSCCKVIFCPLYLWITCSFVGRASCLYVHTHSRTTTVGVHLRRLSTIYVQTKNNLVVSFLFSPPQYMTRFAIIRVKYKRLHLPPLERFQCCSWTVTMHNLNDAIILEDAVYPSFLHISLHLHF